MTELAKILWTASTTVLGGASVFVFGQLMSRFVDAVPGFLCEAHAVAGAEDITAIGDWRKYLAAGT